ncbi:cation diffusion facilitator family transporter [Nakamurella lactea]|uniref:cation diffusion facilitator family transporter n=1 Tax=Nakamurella lactea TaxID=459515 RepID=UPI0004072C53|nr:cation diffusion facilitator family transporter [Nakamurella lactea]
METHSHRADHGTGGHDHGVRVDADRRYLSGALALIVAFLIAEVTVGVIAGSIALISDAGHMLTDAASIVLALIAIRLAAKPARGRWTYGYRRAEILSAQANGLTLLLLAAWFIFESIRRLISPPEVEGLLVFVTALVGIGVNIVAAWLISKANRTSLNIEGAFQHILNDLYAFIATALAGLVVMLTGFTRADAIAALVVAALMILAGYRLVRDSGRIFLEAAPADQDPDVIGPAMAQQPGVTEVHDLHIWDVTSGLPALSAHVLVEPDGDCHAVRRGLEQLLQSDYRIRHTTLQVDHAGADFRLPATLPDPTLARPAGAPTSSAGRPVSRGTGAADGGRTPVQQDNCEDPHGPRHHPVAGRVDSPASPPH